MERFNLVLVPGLLSTDLLWREQLKALTDLADVRVTQQHLRHKSCNAIAEAILEESPPNFAIAGSSMGSHIALLVKKKGGARVTHICLVGTASNINAVDQDELCRTMLKLADQGAYDQIKQQMMELFLNSDNFQITSMRSAVDTMAEVVGLDRFVQQVKALNEDGDLRSDLKDIDCPTLILSGDDDKLSPHQSTREIFQGIQNSKLVTIKGAAHLLPLERPDTVSELMRQWLSGTIPMDGKELIV